MRNQCGLPLAQFSQNWAILSKYIYIYILAYNKEPTKKSIDKKIELNTAARAADHAAWPRAAFDFRLACHMGCVDADTPSRLPPVPRAWRLGGPAIRVVKLSRSCSAAQDTDAETLET